MSLEKNQNPFYLAAPGVVSRRNQDGTIILMRMDDAQFFYKLSGLYASLWAELETTKQASALIQHFSSLLSTHAEALGKDVPSFLHQLEEKGLLVSTQSGENTFRSEPFFNAALKEGIYDLGELKEFDLEQIETEVLNESVYLDVFAGSDLRLKDNMQPLKGALEKVGQLNGMTFQWKKAGQSPFDEKTHVGLVAQEVATVMPDLVRKDADSGLLAVEYSKLNAYLVEAVKDLHRIVRAQEERLQELENPRNA
jgi:hypothetical protein